MNDNQENEKNLSLYVKGIEMGLEGMRLVLENVLSCEYKDYDISYNNQEFRFFNAVTPDEKKQQARLRKLFIRRVLIDCVKNHLSHKKDPWDIIMAFTQGAHLEDHQFEIIIETVSCDEVMRQIESSKPLNMDSPYVQWQDQNKYKFEGDSNA